jgi:chaperone hchA
MKELSKEPVRDRAEHNAYFPSDYSLSIYTSPKTDFDGFKFKKAYEGGKYKVLMVASDERYVQMKNGKLFSTGNHPVETLLPMLHIHHAGFEIDVATLSGNLVKLEMWAMPNEDKNVMDMYQKYLPKLENPLKLSDILKEVIGENSPYLAVFFPGGHGPAALLSGSIDEDKFLFDGYKMTVFPDSLDEGANQEIGYMPGKLKWLLADKLEKLGVKIVNTGITGEVCKDRNVLTGDSPLAANNLGILAANELLAMVE